MKLHTVIVVMVLVAFAEACGGGGNGTSTSDSKSNAVSTSPASRPPDEGCTDQQPNLVKPRTASEAALVRVCRSAAGISLRLKNISDLVLDVWSFSESAPTLYVASPSANSFSDQAVRTMVRSGWDPIQGAYVVEPGANVVGTSYAPFSFSFRIDRQRTLDATAAKGIASMVEAKFTDPRASYLRRVIRCAQNTPEFLNGTSDALGSIRSKFTEVASCRGLLRDVIGGSEPSAVEKAMAKTESLGGAKLIDVLEYALAKVHGYR